MLVFSNLVAISHLADEELQGATNGCAEYQMNYVNLC